MALGIEPGRVLDARVYIQDIMATTLEIAGVEVEPGMIEFESFLPLLAGDKAQGREVIYGGYKNASRSILKGEWKLIYFPKIPRYFLFNLQDDPDEMHDLASYPENQPRVEELKQALAEEMDRLQDHELDESALQPTG